MNRKIIVNTLIKSAIIIIVFLMLAMGWVLWEAGGKNIIPYKKTTFSDYNEFCEQAKSDFFPQKLPETISDIRYYYYSGMMDKMKCVVFVVDSEEYFQVKQQYLSQYNGDENMTDYSNNPLAKEFIQDESLSFMEEMLMESQEDYDIIYHRKSDNEHADYNEGILANDNTYELVFIDYQNVFFSEKNEK